MSRAAATRTAGEPVDTAGTAVFYVPEHIRPLLAAARTFLPRTHRTPDQSIFEGIRWRRRLRTIDSWRTAVDAPGVPSFPILTSIG